MKNVYVLVSSRIKYLHFAGRSQLVHHKLASEPAHSYAQMHIIFIFFQFRTSEMRASSCGLPHNGIMTALRPWLGRLCVECLCRLGAHSSDTLCARTIICLRVLDITKCASGYDGSNALRHSSRVSSSTYIFALAISGWCWVFCWASLEMRVRCISNVRTLVRHLCRNQFRILISLYRCAGLQ